MKSYPQQIDLDSLLEEAERQTGINQTRFHFYAWPQLFSSTAGPHKGMAGQAMTTFLVYGFTTNNKTGLLHCAGLWKKVDNFRPLMHWIED